MILITTKQFSSTYTQPYSYHLPPTPPPPPSQTIQSANERLSPFWLLWLPTCDCAPQLNCSCSCCCCCCWWWWWWWCTFMDDKEEEEEETIIEEAITGHRFSFLFFSFRNVMSHTTTWSPNTLCDDVENCGLWARKGPEMWSLRFRVCFKGGVDARLCVRRRTTSFLFRDDALLWAGTYLF